VWVIFANRITCSTAAVSENIDSRWDAPDNLFCTSQTFLNLEIIFWDGGMLQ
jgi:hypothetical protein